MTEYYPGKGCDCNARNHTECGCDADWTDPRVYKLGSRIVDLEIKLETAHADLARLNETYLTSQWLDINFVTPAMFNGLKRFHTKGMLGSMSPKQTEMVTIGKWVGTVFRFIPMDWYTITHFRECREDEQERPQAMKENNNE